MGRGLKLFFVFDKGSLEPEESPSPDVRSLTEAVPFVERRYPVQEAMTWPGTSGGNEGPRIAGMLSPMRQNLAGAAARAALRVLVVAGCVLAAGSCGASHKDAARPQAEPAPMKQAAPPPEPAGAPAASAGEPGDIPAPPEVAAPPKDAKTSPKGVFYKVLSAGKGGPKPTAEDTVRVHYTGWTTDGKMFDSSVTRGQPNDFPLKHLIPGWTDAIPVMSVGDKVRFWIPEELAYKGKPGTPQGMLVFDVELIAILPPGS